MINAWWLVPAVIVGAVIGVFTIALCSASRIDEKTLTWERDD